VEAAGARRSVRPLQTTARRGHTFAGSYPSPGVRALAFERGAAGALQAASFGAVRSNPRADVTNCPGATDRAGGSRSGARRAAHDAGARRHAASAGDRYADGRAVPDSGRVLPAVDGARRARLLGPTSGTGAVKPRALQGPPGHSIST
jgi:hypothetical protein